MPTSKAACDIGSRKSRTVRIFISSTFRDFVEERDLLVKRVFPALRDRLKSRFVELVDIDLRWGITARQAERGEVLPICLREIDRSRPFFVGLLGERYGWVPDAEAFDAPLISSHPWLKKHRGGKSVTELEILHGVLNNPSMAGRALFYFRSPSYAKGKGGIYLPASPDDARRQRDLKRRIRRSRFPVLGYRDPEALAKRLERDLWKILDETFPQSDVPDPFERESRRHAAYAEVRRRLYIGGETRTRSLHRLLDVRQAWILIEGQSGGGKSALLANAIEAYRQQHPKIVVHEHYTGASTDAASAASLVRRLIEGIRRITQHPTEIESDLEKLFESLPVWLSTAGFWAEKRKTRFVIVLDALNGLTSHTDLRWFPQVLPPSVQLVVSCLPGEVDTALRRERRWKTLTVKPLTKTGSRHLLNSYLGRYNKTLAKDLQRRALQHPLATNPLWIKTLAEELRLFGSHEELDDRLKTLLGPPEGKRADEPPTVDDLFEHVLKRVEEDVGHKKVRRALTGIWAGRAGLSETEIITFCGLKRLDWARLRLALDEALLLASDGRILPAHDYLRVAIKDRYLPNEALQKRAHRDLARIFGSMPVDARVAEELPYQLEQAQAWSLLKKTLTTREMFEALVQHRSDEEHRGYWLALEAHAGKQIMEQAFQKAWKAWRLKPKALTTGDTAWWLGHLLSDAGRYGRFTVQMYRQSLAISERALGPHHLETGRNLNNLALLLQKKGTFSAAEPILRRAHEIYEKVLGANHSEVGISLDNLAMLLRDQGDFDAAESLCRRALTIIRSALGPNHYSTATYLNNLALLLQDKGDYAAAEPLFLRALAISEQDEGPNHPSTCTFRNNLAILQRERGKYSAAEPLFRKTLEIREKTLGPNHPSTGASLTNLAELLHDIGDYAAADLLCRRALAIYEKMLGSKHPDTGSSLNNLALLLQDKGDYAAAEPLFRQALAIRKKALGPNHPGTGQSLNNLALLLQDKGDYAAAEPLFRQALTIAERSQGPDHPSTGTSLNNLASLLEAKGDYAAAEPLFRRALTIAERSEGPDHPSTATSLNNLASLLAAKGDYAAAEPLYRRALAISEQALGPAHPSTGTRLNNLALLLRDKGDLATAESMFQRALTIAERSEGANHPHVGTCLDNLGSLRQENGDYEAAERLFRRALATKERNWGPNHPSILQSLNNLAGLLRDKGQDVAAEPLYRRAVAISENSLGEGHPDASTTLRNLALLLRDKGDYTNSENLFRRALSIRELAFGADHPATNKVRRELEAVVALAKLPGPSGNRR